MCNAFWSVTGKVLNTSGQKINTFIEIIDNCSVSSQLWFSLIYSSSFFFSYLQGRYLRLQLFFLLRLLFLRLRH